MKLSECRLAHIHPSRIRAVTRIHLLAVAALLTLAAPPVAAQTVIKSTMPDGRVIYGDSPMPGARKVEEVSVSAPKINTGGGGEGQGRSSGEQGRLQQQEQAMRARAQEREQREQRVRAAEEALRTAEEAKRNGEEPLPGERLGTAGGASRLTDQYFERQKQLEEAVENARRELNEARNAAR
jgi:hypothetical protein